MPLINVIPIIFMLLLLGSLKLNKNVPKDFLSIKLSNELKGLFSVLIIFYHLTQHTKENTLFQIFNQVGPYIVAGFFFISGFGLYAGLMEKKDYLTGFLKKRFFKVAVPWIIFTFIYVLYYYLSGKKSVLFQLLSNSRNGFLIISNSWYVINILVFYVLFYLIYKNNNQSKFYLNFLILASFITLYNLLIVLYIHGGGVVVCIKLCISSWYLCKEL